MKPGKNKAKAKAKKGARKADDAPNPDDMPDWLVGGSEWKDDQSSTGESDTESLRGKI